MALSKITTESLLDGEITLPKFANLGSDGQVLTSTGGSSPPAFEDAAGGAWTLIGTAVASSSANLTITGLDTSVYDSFVARATNLIVGTDGAEGRIRLGDSGGIDSGGSDYEWVGYEHRSNSTSIVVGGSTGDDKIRFFDYSGTATGENTSITIYLSASAGSTYPTVTWEGACHTAETYIERFGGAGMRQSAINVTQIQILPSTGNYASGRFTVWGIAHA